MAVGAPLAIFVIVLAAILLATARTRGSRARVLRRAGFGLMAAFTLFFVLFVAGETFSDPGGWKAAGLVAAWAVPLAGLAALAWYLPSWTSRIFEVLIGALIGLSIWFAASPEGWRAFENRNGPVRTVITFVLAAAVSVLGLKRPRRAGVMLLVVGIVPVLVSSVGSRLGGVSLTLVSSAPVLTGILYLLSEWVARSAATPGQGTGSPRGPAPATPQPS